MNSTTLEALLACRFTPLEKNPRVCPVGFGGILSWTAGKVVIAATCNDVITRVRALQVCAEHDAGSGALVHEMRWLYNEEKRKQSYKLMLKILLMLLIGKHFYIIST